MLDDLDGPAPPVPGPRRLAAAVLELAVRDAERGDTNARQFLSAGEALPFWCALADIDVTAVIERCGRRWSST